MTKVAIALLVLGALVLFVDDLHPLLRTTFTAESVPASCGKRVRGPGAPVTAINLRLNIACTVPSGRPS